MISKGIRHILYIQLFKINDLQQIFLFLLNNKYQNQIFRFHQIKLYNVRDIYLKNFFIFWLVSHNVFLNKTSQRYYIKNKSVKIFLASFFIGINLTMEKKKKKGIATLQIQKLACTKFLEIKNIFLYYNWLSFNLDVSKKDKNLIELLIFNILLYLPFKNIKFIRNS